MPLGRGDTELVTTSSLLKVSSGSGSIGHGRLRIEECFGIDIAGDDHERHADVGGPAADGPEVARLGGGGCVARPGRRWRRRQAQPRWGVPMSVVSAAASGPSL